MDPIGHGTMVAGLIGARGNNQLGIAGVAFAGGASLVGCKLAQDPASDYGFAVNVYMCLTFCESVRADFTVNSWGLTKAAQYDAALFSMFRDYRSALHVVAAGNDGHLFQPGDANVQVTETSFQYNRNAPGSPAGHAQPGAFSGILPNVITVGAVNLEGTNKAELSNYGSGYVDVWAPGVDIVSTISCASRLWWFEGGSQRSYNGCFPYGGPNAFFGVDPSDPDEKYVYNVSLCVQTAAAAQAKMESSFYKTSGTSFSAPLVAGIAAVVKNINTLYTPAEIKLVLLRSSCRNTQLQASGRRGMANMYEAVQMARTGQTPSCS